MIDGPVILKTTARETADGHAIVVMAGMGNAARGSFHPGHEVRAVLQPNGALVVDDGHGKVLAVYASGTYVACLAQPETQGGLGLGPVPDVHRRLARNALGTPG